MGCNTSIEAEVTQMEPKHPVCSPTPPGRKLSPRETYMVKRAPELSKMGVPSCEILLQAHNEWLHIRNEEFRVLLDNVAPNK